MVGKYGPQAFSKKDYLGSHLLPNDSRAPTRDFGPGSAVGSTLNVLIQSESMPVVLTEDSAGQQDQIETARLESQRHTGTGQQEAVQNKGMEDGSL